MKMKNETRKAKNLERIANSAFSRGVMKIGHKKIPYLVEGISIIPVEREKEVMSDGPLGGKYKQSLILGVGGFVSNTYLTEIIRKVEDSKKFYPEIL